MRAPNLKLCPMKDWDVSKRSLLCQNFYGTMTDLSKTLISHPVNEVCDTVDHDQKSYSARQCQSFLDADEEYEIEIVGMFKTDI